MIKRHPVVEEDLGWIARQPVPWQAFDGATILISGAYGFVVAYLVEALLYRNETAAKPCRVIAVVRNRAKAERRFAAYAGRSDLQYVIQDVCDPVEIEEQVDYVIHGASWASPVYYGSQPVGSLLPNVLGTYRLLELARQHQSRGFLFFSSAEIYGKPDASHVPTPESYPGSVDPLDVRSCYAESKRMGETMCVSWAHQHKVPARMARIFHTYGPGMALDDGRVFADFVRDIVEGRNIRMMSDGRHRRAFCYLADSTVALLTILLKGQVGQAYNMGNDEGEVSILELAGIVAGLFPDRGLRVERVADSHPEGYLRTAIDRACPDTSRLRTLGWQPHYPVAEGFRRTILSYEKPASS